MPERRILLVRHAIAEDFASSGRDFDRALTAEGRRRMERAARGLAVLDVRPDVVLASPLVRARQTAQIVGKALGAEPRTWDALACGVDHEVVSADLDERHPGGTVVLVGHEPDMGELLSCWLARDPRRVAVHFRKGAVACVTAGGRLSEGRAVLEWMLTSSQLGRVADG
ncbi:phosphohistidine phosphatase SixA [bacterium]|nr:phosphohistidine phosphatase SixA [bacterium]